MSWLVFPSGQAFATDDSPLLLPSGRTVVSTRLAPTPSALALQSLGLSNNVVPENTAAGTVIGALTGLTSGSSIALTTNDGNRVALSGTNIVVGATALDYETAGGSRSFSVTETLAGRPNTPNTSTISYTITNVFEAATLGALSFSSTSFTAGTASSGTIVGATATSTITASGLPSGLTINGPARTWAWSGTGTPGSGSFTLTETLADSPNSPRVSTIAYTINSSFVLPISAPVLTKTSAAGAAPFTFDASLNTSDTYAGYTMHVQVAASLTPTKDSNGTYTTPTQDILHLLTESDIITGGDIDISADGFLSWSGAGSLHARIERDDGVTSNWSNDITDTISASVAQWTSTDGVKKSTWIDPPTNGGKTFQGEPDLGAYQCIGATIAGASKSQWEIKFDNPPSTGTPTWSFGRYNGTTNLGTLNARPGVSDANGYCVTIPGTGGTSFNIFFNSGNDLGSSSYSCAACATDDVWTDKLDVSGAAGTHTLTIYQNNVARATLTGKTLTGFLTAWAGTQDNEVITSNWGGQTFAHTLDTGFSMYG